MKVWVCCTNQSHERSLWKEVIPVSAINCFFVVILCIICHFLSFYFSFHTYTHCLFKHVKLLINYFQTFQFWLLRSIVFYKHFTILLLYFLSRNFSFWQTVWAKVLFSPYGLVDLKYTCVYPVPTCFLSSPCELRTCLSLMMSTTQISSKGKKHVRAS